MSRLKTLSFPALDRRGIPLREVIAVHAQFRPRGSLPANLGDGFLCSFNSVFKAVRDAYLARGFRFTTKDFCGYYAFPLMSLDHLIEERKIPYRENFAWLTRLEKEAPGVFTLTELKRGELQFNYLFHESAHLLAHEAFFGRRPPRKLPRTPATLHRILIGEAFANTVECLASAHPAGEIGAYFLDANCHFRSNRGEAALIRRLGRHHGFLPVARAILAGFLYANYLVDRLGVREKAEVARYSGLPKKEAARLAAIGTELCERFRTTTTQLHLVKLGFPGELGGLMRFDPVAKLGREIKLRAQTEALLALAVRGLDGSARE